MEQVQLVYAEAINGITFMMLEDPMVAIISDGAVFIVTTKENSYRYYENDFYPVDEDAQKAYNIRLEDGKVTFRY